MLHLFHYKAIDPQLGFIKGVILSETKPSFHYALFVWKGRKFSLKTQKLLHLIHHIHQMLLVPLPIAEVIRILSIDYPIPMEKAFLSYLFDKISQGHTLYDVLSCANLPSFILTRLYAGEKTGNLIAAFEDVKSYLEKKLLLEKNFAQAIRYPAFLLLSLCVLSCVLGHLMPQVSFLMGLPLLIMSIAFMGYGIWKWIPGSFVFKEYWLTQLITSLGYLLNGHIPLRTALEMIHTHEKSLFVKKTAESLMNSLNQGQSLANAFALTPCSTAFIQEMIQLGETTGRLGPLLVKAAAFLQDQWHEKCKRILSFLEPTLIGIMGLIILWLINLLVLPMYDDMIGLVK